jgi:hypothetical protein
MEYIMCGVYSTPQDVDIFTACGIQKCQGEKYIVSEQTMIGTFRALL